MKVFFILFAILAFLGLGEAFLRQKRDANDQCKLTKLMDTCCGTKVIYPILFFVLYYNIRII